MKNTQNIERAHVIPSNWICNDCPYCERENYWNYRVACNAPIEEHFDGGKYINGEPCKFALYDGIEVPICKRASLEGYIARTCIDDERLHLRGDYVYANDDNYYTNDYATEHFYYCDACGDYVTDSRDYDFDLQMCERCAEEYKREQYRIIGSWHEHKGLFRVMGDRHDTKTIGYEMEVTSGYYEGHEEMAHAIDDEFPNEYFFENDCSLDEEGFEIISNPYTYDAFNEHALEKLERMLTREGYDYTDEDWKTGFHVHFSTAWLGNDEEERAHTFARLVRFYNSNFSLLCSLVDRKDIGHSYSNKSEHYISGDYDDDFDLLESTIHGTRYVAVNGNNYYHNDTFEIRLCDGTICAEKIRAWIDFNIALFDCFREQATTNINDVVPYMSDRAIDYFSL